MNTIEGLSPVAVAERFVLGAIMNTPAVLRDVTEAVMPGEFEDQRLGGIYAGMLRMAADGDPIDYLSVADHLADWDIRGVSLADLVQWAGDVPTSRNVTYHAAMIRNAALARSLRRVGEQLMNVRDPGPVLANALTDLTDLRDRQAASAGSVRMLRDLLSVPEAEDVPEWVIPNVVERGDRLMLTATEGAGKSTLLRQMGLLPAAGIHPFRFSPIPPIRTLFIDAENTERQWRRAIRKVTELAAMQGARDPQDYVGVETMKRSDITKAAILGGIHKRIDQLAPDLVVIGPFYRLAPGAIKDDDDAQPVLDALDSIRERGVAMLIEAHAGHGNGGVKGRERDLRPRGASALLGWPEFGLALRMDKNQAGGETYAVERWRGDRDKATREIPSRFVKGHLWPWEPIYSGN